jgi:YD repeat-containing protein
VPFAKDGWTVTNPSGGTGGFSVTWENGPNVSLNLSIGMTEILGYTDAQERTYSYSYDADEFPTQKTWSDQTTEQTSYNQFKQITRHQDRNLNVTLNTYDAQGNLLSREVGIKHVSGVDTHQPEYAKYQWTYYPSGDPNQFLMASSIDANNNSTSFIYDNSHRLIQVIEPPDAAGDAQATTTISYDTASRIEQISDPMNRAVIYSYDERDRVSKITYGDTSTERFIYGSPGSGNENLLVRQKDRNGATVRYDYDAAGRLSTTTAAYSTMDQADNETLIVDPSVTVTKTCSYLPGTELVSSCTERGETVTYGYDYRHRLVSTTVQPRVGVSLTSTRTYLNNQLFCETDPYGRRKYYGYRASDGELIREIQGTVPSFTLADFNAVMNQTRDQTPNAQLLITDYQLDNVGQRVAVIDGRGNTLAQTFDSRGQLVQSVEASGTPLAATTGYLYDGNGNLIEERTPRYYDSSDPQVGNCRTQMTYTGRNLVATRTEAPGTTVAATVQHFYNLDRSSASMIDARNNTWQTLWSACCAGRKTAGLDPTSAGSSIEYDYAGNPTFVQVVQGTTIYNQATTRYDARRRPIFRTVWLTTAPNVDPNNPPIAGQNGVPAGSGLTTQWYYDENLADAVGLSNPAGENVAGIGTVSIQQLLAEVQSDGITFGTGSDGYTTLEVKPDGELAIAIQDGGGRTVASGVIQPPTAQNPNLPITWSTQLDDTVATVSSPGNLLETVYIDALNSTNCRRTDGADRAIQSVDAESNITAATFDANSNQLSVADPNAVGYSAVFDARNRETSRTDTMNATTATGFDANSNVVRSTDAKSNSSSAFFDARDRRASLTDRIGGTASWRLDANSNVVSLTDSESHTTQFAFDSRNLKIAETYADHNPPSVNDQVTFVYDGAKRLQTRTDQQLDYVTMIYDMASRLTSREYGDSGKQPTDPPNDSDIFTFRGDDHLLTAVCSRYSNTLSFTYDTAGRITSESLTIGGETYTVGRAYDAANRLVTITYPDGSPVGRSFTARNLLQQVSYQAAVAASFGYDVGGRRSTRTLGDTPGTTTTWSYEVGSDLVASISAPNMPSFGYTYDGNSNKTAETITSVLAPYGFSTGASGYDSDDHLIAWDRADGNENEAWTLTNASDWSEFANASGSQTRTHNIVHELTAVNGAAFSYDAKGNLVSDATTGASYAWDFDNQLAEATTSGLSATFAYDALGRRVSKASGGNCRVFVEAMQEGRKWGMVGNRSRAGEQRGCGLVTEVGFHGRCQVGKDRAAL